jgi:hypothetical protein
MVVLGAATNSLNFAQPVLSLIGMTPQIIINPLLTAIQAHFANVLQAWRKTTAKPRPIVALQFSHLRD